MGETPRTFWDEFQECLEDISTDLDAAVTDFDPIVLGRIHEGVLGVLREAAGDGEKAIADLVAMNVWMFLTGREHAGRGYTGPINRNNDDVGIPDTIDDMFKEN